MFAVTFLFLKTFIFFPLKDATADTAFPETTSPVELHMSQQRWEIDIRGNEVIEMEVQAAVRCYDIVFLPGDLILMQLSGFWLLYDESL